MPALEPEVVKQMRVLPMRVRIAYQLMNMIGCYANKKLHVVYIRNDAFIRKNMEGGK